MRRYAIILSGGRGVRFWPLSRESMPKQFLGVSGGKPLIAQTLARVLPLAGKANTYIAAGIRHRPQLESTLAKAGFPAANFFFEPSSRNTFAPIAFLTKRIAAKEPAAVICVFPSDHWIKDEARFRRLLRRSMEIAASGRIVALGVPPARPETGYGYIKRSLKKGDFCLVEKFIEKPDAPTAARYVKDKRYYWNAGIFVFRADTMLGEIKKYCPAAYALLERMGGKRPSRRLWQKMPAVSIDYAVMEKTTRLALVEARFGWSDLGSWQSLDEVMPQDERGNILKGNCLCLGSKRSVVWAHKRLVVAIGLEDMVVADTDDALLVCPKGRAQEIKDAVELLRKRRCRRI